MLISQILREERASPLFHGTSLQAAEKILASDTIHATQRTASAVASKSGQSQFPAIVSLSRAIAVSAAFSSRKMSQADQKRGVNAVVFAIDEARLYRDLGKRIRPYSDDPTTSRSKFTEAEEMVVGDITNIDKYITDIYVFANDDIVDNIDLLYSRFPLVMGHALTSVVEYTPNIVQTSVLRSPKLHPREIVDLWKQKQVDESVAKTIATGGLIGALAAGIGGNLTKSPGDYAQDYVDSAKTSITQALPSLKSFEKHKLDALKTQKATQKSTNELAALKKLPPNPVRDSLAVTAYKNGIRGVELAQFLAQTHHESLGFKRMEEMGSPAAFMRKYDKTKNPSKAKTLGNTERGDGAKYFGRGHIQLTGKYNYKIAGEALGLPLEKKPELAADPSIAEKIAVWFWNTRVKQKVSDFDNVRLATRPINPALNGLEDRTQLFDFYKKILGINDNE